jgi:hypothetical protein
MAAWRRTVVVPVWAALAIAVLVVAVGRLIWSLAPGPSPSEAELRLETLTALVERVSDPAERARLEAERLRLLDERARRAGDRPIQVVTAFVQSLGVVGLLAGPTSPGGNCGTTVNCCSTAASSCRKP